MKRIWLLLLMCALLMVSCQQGEPSESVPTTPIVTQTAVITNTPTATPTLEPSATRTLLPSKTKTITPTPTPTTLEIEVLGNPVRQGTQLPAVEPITMENIDRLEEIGRWGYGSFLDVKLSSDNEEIFALTYLGVFKFNASTLREIDYIAMSFGECDSDLQFSPLGNYVSCFIYAERRSPNIDPPVIQMNIYSAKDGTLYRSLRAEYKIDYAWITPDDERIFVVDRNVQVWDIETETWTGEEYSRFKDLQFLADGESFVAFDTRDDKYYLYTADGEKSRLPSTGSIKKSYPISPDGNYAVGIWENDGELFVVDVETGEKVFTYCYDPALCSSESETAASLKLARELLERDGPYPYTEVESLVFSSDSKRLMAQIHIEYDDFVFLFDLPSGDLIYKEKGWFYTIEFFGNTGYYLDWSNIHIDKKNMYNTDYMQTVPDPYSNGITAEISDDSSLLFTAVGNRIEIYNLLDGALVNYVALDNPITDIALFQKNPWVLAGKGWDKNEAVIWDYYTGEMTVYDAGQEYGYVNSFSEVQITADEKYIRFMDDLRNIYTFDVRTGELVNEGISIRAVANPIKSEFAYLREDEIEIYVIGTETLEYQLQETLPSPGCGDFWDFLALNLYYLSSGDGFTCLGESEVIVFGDFGVHRMPYRDPIPDLWAYLKPLFTISQDNSLLLLSHTDGILGVYDVFADEKLFNLKMPGTSLVQFTPDNKYLVTLGTNNIFHIYGVPAED